MTTTSLPGELAMNGTEPRASNVIEALARVMRDLPNIGKDHTSPQGYQYRGIEDITRAAQRLLAREGVVMAPHRVEWQEPARFTINNKPWSDERIMVTYRIYGPGGADDYIEVQAPGIGRDNADKGGNKAMTQAFKYALIQALCIADGKDDVDGAANAEADAPAEPLKGWASLAEQDEQHVGYRTVLEGASEQVREALKAWKREQQIPYPMTRDEYDATVAELKALMAEESLAMADIAKALPLDGDES